MGEEIEAYFGGIYKWVRTDKKSKVFHVRGALDSLIASLIDILNFDEPGDVKAEINSLEYNLEQICGPDRSQDTDGDRLHHA